MLNLKLNIKKTSILLLYETLEQIKLKLFYLKLYLIDNIQ